MPTGYTYPVADGEITELPEFAKLCARAFGALIMMRDHPFDAEVTDEAFTPHTEYYDTQLQEAYAMLDRLRGISDAECEVAAGVQFDEEMAAHNAYVAEIDAKHARYSAMIQKVKAWSPPTDGHISLRTFMLDQLRESQEFDCGHTPTPPTRLTGEQWRSAQAQKAARDVEYSEKHRQEEIERSAKRKAWWDALCASLPSKNP